MRNCGSQRCIPIWKQGKQGFRYANLFFEMDDEFEVIFDLDLIENFQSPRRYNCCNYQRPMTLVFSQFTPHSKTDFKKLRFKYKQM